MYRYPLGGGGRLTFLASRNGRWSRSADDPQPRPEFLPGSAPGDAWPNGRSLLVIVKSDVVVEPGQEDGIVAAAGE